MKRQVRSTLVAATAAAAAVVIAAPAFAAAQAPVQQSVALFTQQEPQTSSNVLPMLIWMVVGVALVCIVGGIGYLFKRQVGAFPRNPTWVAPISIMRSRDLAGDADPHETHGDSAHDATAHGAAPSAPAH